MSRFAKRTTVTIPGIESVIQRLRQQIAPAVGSSEFVWWKWAVDCCALDVSASLLSLAMPNVA